MGRQYPPRSSSTSALSSIHGAASIVHFCGNRSILLAERERGELESIYSVGISISIVKASMFGVLGI